MLRPTLLAALLGLASTAIAKDDPSNELIRAVRAGLEGDRSGACLAVALIDGDRVQRAYECADRATARPIGPDSAFEIGSVTKPMTAALLAMHIAEGRASLDDPLAKHLSPGTRVPLFGSEPIRLRHLVTHTSGLPPLPPGMAPADPMDPYAGLTPAALVDALGRTPLDRAPGTRFEYSNFAMMLLSHVVSQLGGADVGTQLRTRMFEPLGMHGAHAGDAPAGVTPATGHLSTGQPTRAWTFHRELAGVGGVRATLDDMVRYVQANLDRGDTPLQRALVLAQAPVVTPATPSNIGMNWLLQRWKPGGTLVAHEGGTGGFSSLVAFVPGTRRGVVILSDTSVNALGGLGALGMHLLDSSNPAPKPRRAAKAPADLLKALAGRYQLAGGLGMRLWSKDGVLWGQADGQPAFEFGYDDAGDFYPRAFDALLSPQAATGGRRTFHWIQGGGAMLARRVDETPASSTPPKPVATGPLEDYVGTYPLAPAFALKVTLREGRLHVQGTGQPAIPVEPIARDVFAAEVVAAELHFERDAGGTVVAVTLRQAGQALRGERTQ
jgi:CubicO group peptidase (beta-lactamase class C family)